MKKFLNQAEYNELFLEKLLTEFPCDFHDWKITVIFYTSLHYIKCYALTQSITLGNHHDTFEKLNSGILTLGNDDSLKRKYVKLYGYSKVSRYSGFLTMEAFNTISEMNLKEARPNFMAIKSFVIQELERKN